MSVSSRRLLLLWGTGSGALGPQQSRHSGSRAQAQGWWCQGSAPSQLGLSDQGWIRASHVGRRILTHWATREARVYSHSVAGFPSASRLDLHVWQPPALRPQWVLLKTTHEKLSHPCSAPWATFRRCCFSSSPTAAATWLPPCDRCSCPQSLSSSPLNILDYPDGHPLIERERIGLFSLSSIQSFSRVRPFATPWTAAHQASRSITNSRSPPKLMSIELVTPSNHLILSSLLLLPSIFPSSRVFSNESVLHIFAKVLEFQLHQSFQWTPRTDLI